MLRIPETSVNQKLCSQRILNRLQINLHEVEGEMVIKAKTAVKKAVGTKRNCLTKTGHSHQSAGRSRVFLYPHKDDRHRREEIGDLQCPEEIQ